MEVNELWHYLYVNWKFVKGSCYDCEFTKSGREWGRGVDKNEAIKQYFLTVVEKSKKRSCFDTGQTKGMALLSALPLGFISC